jgi:hypothetical protein
MWNQFIWPLAAVSRLDLQVIQVMIASQTTDRQVYWGRTFAGLVSAVVPVVILFLSCQRLYLRGAVLSGMKLRAATSRTPFIPRRSRAWRGAAPVLHFTRCRLLAADTPSPRHRRFRPHWTSFAAS